jgi:hypothetical protein
VFYIPTNAQDVVLDSSLSFYFQSAADFIIKGGTGKSIGALSA